MQVDHRLFQRSTVERKSFLGIGKYHLAMPGLGSALTQLTRLHGITLKVFYLVSKFIY